MGHWSHDIMNVNKPVLKGSGKANITMVTDLISIWLYLFFRYPSDNTLLSSFKEESKWIDYRERVMSEAVRPLSNQARRRPLVEYQESVQSAKKKQSSRLLNILARNQRKEQRLIDIQKKLEPSGMALDTVALPSADDEFTIGCNDAVKPSLPESMKPHQMERVLSKPKQLKNKKSTLSKMVNDEVSINFEDVD